MLTPSYPSALLPEGVEEQLLSWVLGGGVICSGLSPCLLPPLFVSGEPADFRRKGVLSQTLASPVHSSG